MVIATTATGVATAEAHSSFDVHIHYDRIVLQSPDDALIIDRATSTLSLHHGTFHPTHPARESPTFTAYGVFGIIRLLAGDYLILVTGRQSIVTVQDQHPLYEITGTKLQLMAPSSVLQRFTPDQWKEEQQYIQMVESYLKLAPMFTSYTSPLVTQSWQRMKLGTAQPSLWEQADERFFWNRMACKALIDTTRKDADNDLSPYILPIMSGFVHHSQHELQGRTVDFILISRRSWQRLGTRYHARGSDAQGNVANFIETEQIILTDNAVTSFVQIRGSMPFYWKQIINGKYTPKLWIAEEDAFPAFSRHLQTLKQIYGENLFLINLNNTHGYEAPLGIHFARLVQRFKENFFNVFYIHFDFHKECSKMRYDRLSLLLDKVDLQQVLFYAETNGRAVQWQQGVCRTNCMDCLDRTNVVQSQLARQVLFQQLERCGILSVKQLPLQDENIYRTLWADHADAMSVAYSGTPALKTDFTRTGKRTWQGALADGYHSVQRYWLNNYYDGWRQDALDLMTGKSIVSKQGIVLLHQHDFYQWFLVLVMLFLVFLWSALSLASSIWQQSLVLLSLLALVLIVRVLWQQRDRYLSWPLLSGKVSSMKARPSVVIKRD